MIDIEKFIFCLIKLSKIHNFKISNKINDIENLRKFHNNIKNNLIINSCLETNATSLLDIACGRGGDLQKWINNKLNLKYILAFDSHKESIFSSIKKGDSFDGAIARFLNIKNYYKGKLPFINFKYLNILDSNILNQINKIDSNKHYDVISCQFALHYFSQNDQTLNNVLNIISKKLSKNGLFIGTATDGDLINNILSKGNVNIPLLTLIKQLNNNYLFYIQTDKTKNLTRQNYFELQGVSSEFFLFKEKLKILCENNNLELVNYTSFYEYYLNYKKLKPDLQMSIYQMIISFLNFSFVFRKIN
jgi:mRNA (guanine-N7-)-methyltransferase